MNTSFIWDRARLSIAYARNTCNADAIVISPPKKGMRKPRQSRADNVPKPCQT